MRNIPVPGGVLELHDDGLTVTRYAGGLDVPARAHATPEYRRRALEHGYGGDVDLMSREHEAAHHLLARLLGLAHSPTLMGVVARPHWWGWQKEEGAVLALQRYARAVGVDLVERLAASD